MILKTKQGFQCVLEHLIVSALNNFEMKGEKKNTRSGFFNLPSVILSFLVLLLLPDWLVLCESVPVSLFLLAFFWQSVLACCFFNTSKWLSNILCTYQLPE